MFKTKKGETLIEVITALTSLVIAGLAAVTVILAVMNTTAISKDYLIAQNLASEGLEGVINIRDTNWLIFSSDKTNCWMIIDSLECKADGTDKKAIAGNNYTLEGIEGAKLKLKDQTSLVKLDLESGTDEDNSVFKLQLNTDGIYTQDQSATPKDPQPSPVFYRMITLSKVDDGDADSVFTQERIKITVKIQWEIKSKVNTYELSSVITNYEK